MAETTDIEARRDPLSLTRRGRLFDWLLDINRAWLWSGRSLYR